MKVTVQGKTVEFNWISISAKCSDLCAATLMNDKKPVAEHNGYVPALMPERNTTEIT